MGKLSSREKIKPCNEFLNKENRVKRQLIDYDGTSYCKNKGKYANLWICKAGKSNCRYYASVRKRDGSYTHICKKRYIERRDRKPQEDADIKKIKDISTYNGRNN